MDAAVEGHIDRVELEQGMTNEDLEEQREQELIQKEKEDLLAKG